MTLQIILALGIMYAAMGIAMLSNPTQIKKAFGAIFKNDGQLFILGFLSMLFGVVILTLHRSFGSPMEIVVTVFGILALIKGIIYMAYPHTFKDKALAALKDTKNIRSIGVIYLAIGGLFVWKALWCGCFG